MRRVVGVAALAVATLSLTACQKPPPGITVFSGPESTRAAALCWAFDTPQLSPGQCATDILSGQRTTGAPRVDVAPGNVVGISVDPAVADAGWTVSIGEQSLSGDTPLTTTYFRFTLPGVASQLGNRALPLQIVAGADGQIRGVWIVGLQPQTG